MLSRYGTLTYILLYLKIADSPSFNRFVCHPAKGVTRFWWRPGQKASLTPPCSKLRSFGSKNTVLKKVLVTLLGLFGVPRSDLEPGELCSFAPPRYAPVPNPHQQYISSNIRVQITKGTSKRFLRTFRRYLRVSYANRNSWNLFAFSQNCHILFHSL